MSGHLRPHSGNLRRPSLALPLVAALAVAAYEAPIAVRVEAADNADNLEILAPLPGFTPARLPSGWVIDGSAEAAREGITVVGEGGVPALKVVNGKQGFVLARRTRAVLLATPYLSWAWNVVSHGTGIHPVNLVIGFQGGGRESKPPAGPGTTLPPHDRILAIAWGDSALNRGSLTPALAGQARVAPLRGQGRAREFGLLVAGNGGPFPNLFPGMAGRRYRAGSVGVHRPGGGRRPVARRRPYLGRQAVPLKPTRLATPKQVSHYGPPTA